MEYLPSPSAPFSVVEFEDGLSVVSTSWLTFNNKGECTSSFYPHCDDKKIIDKSIMSHMIPDSKWGKQYPVVKHLRYAHSYEGALKKLDLLLDLSEIDTDDALNAEKLKKSRQLRAKIVKTEKLTSQEKINISSFKPKITFQSSVSLAMKKNK
ncbi:uncharacterized protein LOC127289542 [Leptopilina boulardi]|uniref:uncharacterized protein LOC127289542 n=1 Tax=Leptopilina boulardi TaxID=63433 RepID=UPI0021F5DB1B|nr:uncharacterized protein LOC127289542 [Leptopilina boulardi]